MKTMFRAMRRSAQALPKEECEAVLRRRGEGVLAVSGDEGYPYAVPVNYAYEDGKILLHSAKAGHKMDALRRCDKVSFCVIDEDTVVPEEYSTAYRSVIVFGRARIIEDRAELLRRLDEIAVHFVKDGPEARRVYIEKYIAGVAVVEITAEHITGKEGRLLQQQRL